MLAAVMLSLVNGVGMVAFADEIAPVGDVVGPENVCDVLIAEWRDEPYSEEQIQKSIERMVKIWKDAGFEVYPETVPFETNSNHPVDQDELGKKMYVLLIGLDANGDAAGYAVVEEIIG